MAGNSSDAIAPAETNWAGVAFGLSLAVLAAYQHLKLPPVLPAMLERYGYDTLVAGGFMSIYAVAGFLLSTHLGAAMHRFGAKPFIYGALALLLAGSGVALAVPESGWIVLVARGLEGIAYAVLTVAGPAFCNMNVGRRGLAFAAALFATWLPIGGIASGLLAASLGGAGETWRVMWWVGIGATLALALWAGALHRSGRVDLSAAPIAGTASAGATTRRQWAALALAAILFMAWTTQMLAFMTWLPQFLVTRHGLPAGGAALGFVLAMAMLGVFNLVAGQVLRQGVSVSALLAATFAAQAAIWLFLPIDGGGSVVTLLLFGMVAGMTPTCLFALPATIFGVDKAGTRAFGPLMAGRNVGVLVGPLLVAAIVKYTGDWTLAPKLFALLMGLAFLGALALRALLARAAPATVQGTSR